VKRFWKTVTVAAAEGGWTVTLDDRPIRTPARALLMVPSERLGEAIADEWRSVDTDVDPRAMPLTGLANAAVDRVAPDRAAFAATLSRYAEADLACYRAEGPRPLIERQVAQWDALLAWARRRFDVDFRTTSGLMHVDQPAATVERLSHAISAQDAFRMAALSPLITIGGSLVAALAVLEGALSPDEAWTAVTVDDQWQAEQWGVDDEAQAALANRRHDFMAAARFIDLLG